MPKEECSHRWRDVRYINGAVYNWDVLPIMALESTGEPKRMMQYGQRYQCVNCLKILEPARHTVEVENVM